MRLRRICTGCFFVAVLVGGGPRVVVVAGVFPPPLTIPRARVPPLCPRVSLARLAEGKRTQAVLRAQGEAEGIRLLGAAEAASIRAIGEAEASAMRARAEAYKNYGEAAVMSLILESLPKIAAEVAAPLGQVKEIVVLGGSGAGDGLSGEIRKLVSSLPPSVQAITGVDLTGALKNLVGASSA